MSGNDVGVEERRETGETRETGEIARKDQRFRKYVIAIPSSELQTIEKIENILKLANDKSYGRAATYSDVFAMAIDSFDIKEVENLKERLVTNEERLRIAYDNFLEKSGEKIGYTDFLLRFIDKKLLNKKLH